MIAEWVEKIGTEQASKDLEELMNILFPAYFNQENSNEVNATLLEVLPCYAKKVEYFEYVKSLAT